MMSERVLDDYAADGAVEIWTGHGSVAGSGGRGAGAGVARFVSSRDCGPKICETQSEPIHSFRRPKIRHRADVVFVVVMVFLVVGEAGRTD